MQAPKSKAVTYLTAAKEEVEQKEPDKELIAKNLKRVTDAVKTTSETIEAGNKLWGTMQKMLPAIAPWLGAAWKLLGF